MLLFPCVYQYNYFDRIYRPMECRLKKAASVKLVVVSNGRSPIEETCRQHRQTDGQTDAALYIDLRCVCSSVEALLGPPAACSRTLHAACQVAEGLLGLKPVCSASNHPAGSFSRTYHCRLTRLLSLKHLIKSTLNLSKQPSSEVAFSLSSRNSCSGLKWCLVWEKPPRCFSMFQDDITVFVRREVLLPSARPLFTLKGPSCSLEHVDCKSKDKHEAARETSVKQLWMLASISFLGIRKWRSCRCFICSLLRTEICSHEISQILNTRFSLVHPEIQNTLPNKQMANSSCFYDTIILF